jgi:hypothetical protein
MILNNNTKLKKTNISFKIVDVTIIIIIFSSFIYMILKKELKIFIFEYLNISLQQNKPKKHLMQNHDN